MRVESMRYTLLADGPSDVALVPLLTWLLEQKIALPIQEQWADLRSLPHPPHGIENRIRAALDLFPCDLLFIHRDAEGQPPSRRYDEVEEARIAVGLKIPCVSVVPVRMSEAWFLFDEPAIRRAAGNPNGKALLSLPPKRRVEECADPKEVLNEALKTASGLSGRRLKQFPTAGAIRLVARNIEAFTPLRGVPSFDRLEADIGRVVEDQGWTP